MTKLKQMFLNSDKGLLTINEILIIIEYYELFEKMEEKDDSRKLL